MWRQFVSVSDFVSSVDALSAVNDEVGDDMTWMRDKMGTVVVGQA